MEKKKQGPKNGNAKKWSERLKQISDQAPPEDLMKILNQTEKPKKSAKPINMPTELDI